MDYNQVMGAFGHHHNRQKILYDRKSTGKIRPKLPLSSAQAEALCM